MRCLSLSAYGDISVGDVVCQLPSADASGFIVVLQAVEPYFRVLSARDDGPDDVAWIEFAEGRLVITPTTAPPACYGDRDVAYLNGVAVHRPLEVWPGSRLALLLTKRFFFFRPPPDMEQRLPELVEGAAAEAHLAMLRRRVLMVHHLDQQALRIMRADQVLARLEREADVLGKQAAAMELKQANGAKRLRGLRDQTDLVSKAMAAERRAMAERQAEAEARGAEAAGEEAGEEAGAEIGGGPSAALAELKKELKRLREQCTDMELSALESKAESAKSRREEAKTRREFDRVTAMKVELENRVAEVVAWLQLLRPCLHFASQHMSADAKAEAPTKKEVLAHFFPPPPPPAQGEDPAEEEDVDERPAVDLVLSDPATLSAQRWLAHLLAVSEITADLPRASDRPDTVPMLLLAPRGDGGDGSDGGGAPPSVAEAARTGAIAMEVSLRELQYARPLGLAEVVDAAATVAGRAAAAAARASLAVMPFAQKQRVTVYEASSGAWLTARVLSCRPSEVEVILEETKRERWCPVNEVQIKGWRVGIAVCVLHSSATKIHL